MARGPGQWRPAEATQRINAWAARDDLTLSYTLHAKQRLAERGLSVRDLIYLLKTGFVYDEAEPTSRDDQFKYLIEGTTPNSEGRTIRAVVIPSGECEITVVTVMWRDER
jgi:Domain of unknown function (DUF4258)